MPFKMINIRVIPAQLNKCLLLDHLRIGWNFIHMLQDILDVQIQNLFAIFNPLPARKIFALTMASAKFFWAHGQFRPLRVWNVISNQPLNIHLKCAHEICSKLNSEQIYICYLVVCGCFFSITAVWIVDIAENVIMMQQMFIKFIINDCR